MKEKPKKILILGSGALKIGEAGEFDYSGSQAIKAIKEEGIEVVVVNPNIATYQTSEGLADTVYFLPVNPHFVTEVIKQEIPDGILLSFGGQTALNCGLELFKRGIIESSPLSKGVTEAKKDQRKVKKPLVLGTPISAIEKTEDRDLFVKTLNEVRLLTPKSKAAKTVKQAIRAAEQIGFPVILRSAFSLGGQGSAFAHDKAELKKTAEIALTKSPQVLIEEDLTGWKEIEYEVVRDKNNNCITVCNMENFDPMGVHTGESIVVAPSQTLTNTEYHQLREISLKLIRHLGIIGECNIQFALRSQKSKIKNNDYDINYRIIEVNARLSRSSALASKATGYPLAFIAAKLALGYTLSELPNAVTKKTCAFFEPSLDYIVVKMPRWDLDKFKHAERAIGSQMKSVGEVMSIGRTFEEAIQKASRMLGLDQNALVASYKRLSQKYPDIDVKLNGNGKQKVTQRLKKLIKNPNEHRLLAIVESLRRGLKPETISKWSSIDQWFIEKLKNITDLMKQLENERDINKELIVQAKYLGFSDKQISVLQKRREADIYIFRKKHAIQPCVNHIDTLAAEYPAKTNYLYLTYPRRSDSFCHQIQKKNSRKTIIILGSGVYRIGSSVEFDWCAVTCARVLRDAGYKVVMVNHNPETVSTDFDMADTLYFDELNFETVREIYEREKPYGLIVSVGGQTPNNIALKCMNAGMNILGTSPKDIDRAENRYKFSQLLNTLNIDQPQWKELTSIEEAKAFASLVQYPVLIRPSYVLSGAAMNIAFNEKDLEGYLLEATFISPEHPVVMTKFIVGAKEIEVDAVAQNGRVIADVISEHIENAGVHSGDATIACPPQNIYIETMRRIKIIMRKIAMALRITGPFNIQFLARENDIKVIECNLRASRSFPFVSKVTGTNLIELATLAMVGSEKNTNTDLHRSINLLDIPYVGVKAPQFSFSRLKGADPILRVEMASTGEVATLGKTLEAAYLKSIISTGFNLPQKGVLLSLGGDLNKTRFLNSAVKLVAAGYHVYATNHTSQFLSKYGIKNIRLYKLHESPQEPNIKTYLLKKKVDMVIIINDFDYAKAVKTDSYEVDDDYELRRTAVDLNVPILTDLQTAKLFIRAICRYKLTDLDAHPWKWYLDSQQKF